MNSLVSSSYQIIFNFHLRETVLLFLSFRGRPLRFV